MELRWYQVEAVEALLKSTDNTIAVLPTGAGKTLTLTTFVQQFKGKILILSHVREIVEQNFMSLVACVDDVGLYSAGLGMKHIDRITVGGIQSVYPNLKKFKDVDLVIIDECHLVSESGMYNTTLKTIGCRYIGLTATPYRLKEGYLHHSGIFDSICYEAPVDKLTEQGYLSPLKTYGSTDNEFDTSSLKTVAGDYSMSDMSLAFDRETISRQICSQLLKYKDKYKHWLLFCIDIKHAENVAAILNELGVMAEAVHSDSPRDQALEDFKSGKIQAVTNVNILTVGFDFPAIDMIVILRPTKSPVLHVQALGRGMRTWPGKDHCLVKDYSGNIGRLGMVENLRLSFEGRAKGTGKGQSPFLKTCPECDLIQHPSIRVCECGHKFQFQHHLNTTAHVEQKEVWYEVKNVMYNIHHKAGSPNSLKVSYICGTRVFSEWVLIGHTGFARHKAKHWVNRRWQSNEPAPDNLIELYKNSNKLWRPSKIKVEEQGKYPKILAVA